MRQAEKNLRHLEAARRVIEPFEPVNPCQLQVKGILAGAPGAYDRAAVRVRETGASDRMDEFADRASGDSA